MMFLISDLARISIYKFCISFLLFFSISLGLSAQESTPGKWERVLDKYKIKTSIGFQIWSTYSIGQEVFDDESNTYESVDDRFNTQLRRSRLSVTGHPYEQLKFKLTASLDLVGRDVLAATQGGANNGSFPGFGLWNAYLQWQIKKDFDGLHITLGYLSPQIGRESITGAMRYTSFEKAWSQNYLRRNIVGIGPGRATGINFGGQFNPVDEAIGFKYDLGIFSPVATGFSGNSIGKKASPLLTGRVVTNFGDPESATYSLSHKINYFGKRKGLSLAFAGSWQGNTDLFKSNLALGMDWLFNYGPLNIDGEWTLFSRKGNNEDRAIEVNSNGGYLRLGYNVQLKGRAALEPVIMYVEYNGPLKAMMQSEATLMGAFSGNDQIYYAGVNYYFNPNFKLTISYTHNNGDLGDAPPGATFNNYYFQKGIGAIKRGNLIGLGTALIF